MACVFFLTHTIFFFFRNFVLGTSTLKPNQTTHTHTHKETMLERLYTDTSNCLVMVVPVQWGPSGVPWYSDGTYPPVWELISYLSQTLFQQSVNDTDIVIIRGNKSPKVLNTFFLRGMPQTEMQEQKHENAYIGWMVLKKDMHWQVNGMLKI